MVLLGADDFTGVYFFSKLLSCRYAQFFTCQPRLNEVDFFKKEKREMYQQYVSSKSLKYQNLRANIYNDEM